MEINCEKINFNGWKKRYVLISLFSRTVSGIIVVFRKDRSSLKVHFLERFSSGELLRPEVKECGLSWKGSPKTKIGSSSGTEKGLVFLFEPLQGHMLLFWRSMKAGKSNKRVQQMIKKVLFEVFISMPLLTYSNGGHEMIDTTTVFLDLDSRSYPWRFTTLRDWIWNKTENSVWDHVIQVFDLSKSQKG